MTDLVAQGLPVVVDEVFALDDYPAALERLDAAATSSARSSCATDASVRHGGRHGDASTAKERMATAVDAPGRRRCSTPRTRSTPTPSWASRSTTPTTCSPTSSSGEGLAVERRAYGLDTAFVARAGTDGPDRSPCCCEYDALPGIGHACGHNIIAAAGLGAGLAAAALADELGGRVVVLGTPAEEGGGGKVLMAERGAFDGVDAAMMVHPADADLPRDGRHRRSSSSTVDVPRRGRPRRRRSRTRAATPSTPPCSAT